MFWSTPFISSCVPEPQLDYDTGEGSVKYVMLDGEPCCHVSSMYHHYYPTIIAELDNNDKWVWTRSRKPVLDPFNYTEGQCRSFEGWNGDCKAQWIPTDSPDYKGAPMRM